MKLVVLASNRGSNFAAIAQAIEEGRLNATIEALVCHRENVPVLERARQLQIPVEVVPSQSFKENGKLNRPKFEQALRECIEKYSPDFLCLAGYLLILGPELLERWPEQILNIHPSLLPAFRGLHAQQQAIDAGVEWAGCTVHLVTGELDGGPILAQSVVQVRAQDTVATLSERLLPVEHATYVTALQRLSTIPYQIQRGRVVWGSTPK